MQGSPQYKISWPEFAQWAWVSLLFAVAAFVGKFIELGNAMDWGDLAAVWATVAAALAWLVKRFVTDTTSSGKVFRRSKN